MMSTGLVSELYGSLTLNVIWKVTSCSPVASHHCVSLCVTKCNSYHNTKLSHFCTSYMYFFLTTDIPAIVCFTCTIFAIARLPTFFFFYIAQKCYMVGPFAEHLHLCLPLMPSLTDGHM